MLPEPVRGSESDSPVKGAIKTPPLVGVEIVKEVPQPGDNAKRERGFSLSFQYKLFLNLHYDISFAHFVFRSMC